MFKRLFFSIFIIASSLALTYFITKNIYNALLAGALISGTISLYFIISGISSALKRKRIRERERARERLERERRRRINLQNYVNAPIKKNPSKRVVSPLDPYGEEDWNN
jgi:hypothetical protein